MPLLVLNGSLPMQTKPTCIPFFGIASAAYGYPHAELPQFFLPQKTGAIDFALRDSLIPFQKNYHELLFLLLTSRSTPK